MIDFVGGLDEFDADGQMLGEDFYFGRVNGVVRTETGKRTSGRRAEDALMEEKVHDLVMQRKMMMLRILVDEDGDLLGGAFGEHEIIPFTIVCGSTPLK